MDSLFLYVQEGERYICGTTIFGHTPKKCPKQPERTKKNFRWKRIFVVVHFFAFFPIFLLLLLQVETVVEKEESL